MNTGNRNRTRAERDSKPYKVCAISGKGKPHVEDHCQDAEEAILRRDHFLARNPGRKFVVMAKQDNIHSRIAEALGWEVRDTQSLSLQSLRELVRPVNLKLANEITLVINGDIVT